MTNDCKTCPVSTGTHKPAEAVHQIDEPKLSIEAVLSDLRESHARTTFGHWGKGDTTHETVSRGGRHKEYKIAEFRHADDATFCDLAHAFTPRLIEEIEIQRARIAEMEKENSYLNNACAELEAQLEAIGAGGVEPLRKGFVRLTDVLARLEQGFGANSAPVTTIKRHFEMQAAPAHPAEGVPAQASREAVIQHLTNAGVLEHDGCGVFIASGVASELIDACMTLPLSTHPTQQGLDAQDAARFRGFAACMLRQDCAFEDAVEAYPKPDFEIATIDDVRAMVDAGLVAAQAKQGGF